jgi:hypothetical protein
MMASDIAQLMFDASVRIEKMLWIPGVCAGATDDFKDFIDDDLLDAEEVHRALPWIKHFAEKEWPAEDILCELARKNANGFFVQLATPVPSNFSKSGGYCSSWGHYRTKWFYFDSLEAIGQGAVAWADRVVETARKKQTALTQSDLDDMRQHATHRGKHPMAMTGHEVLALLDRIAELQKENARGLELAAPEYSYDSMRGRIDELTAERDEALATIELERRQEEALRCDFEDELKAAQARIAELTERDERKEQALLKIIERKEQALLEITIHRASKGS